MGMASGIIWRGETLLILSLFLIPLLTAAADSDWSQPPSMPSLLKVILLMLMNLLLVTAFSSVVRLMIMMFDEMMESYDEMMKLAADVEVTDVDSVVVDDGMSDDGLDSQHVLMVFLMVRLSVHKQLKF